MALKPDKAKKAAGKTNSASEKKSAKKASSKHKKIEKENDGDNFVEEEDDVKASRKGTKVAATAKKSWDNDEEEVDDGPDEWEKPEEEVEWDPDFDEFDVPKSKAKKN